MLDSSKPLYVFIHLAKTGGTTFVGHLYKHMKVDEEFIDLGPHGNEYREEHKRPPLEKRTKAELDKVTIVAGHLARWGVNGLFPDRQHRYVTFLREPISRVISHYTFDTSKQDMPFSQWYQNWIHNQTTLFWYDHLNVDSIAGILNCFQYFWHIGLTENLTPSLHILFDELRIPRNFKNRRVAGEKENSTKDLGYDSDRVIKPKYQPTRSEITQITKDHNMDIWLYNHVASRLVNGHYIPDPNLVIPSFS